MIPAQFDYVRPGEPGRGAADPQGPRRGGEAAVGRLQPHPAHQAPPRPAGPPRRHARHHRPRRHHRDRRRAAHRRPGHPPPGPRQRHRPGPLPGPRSTSPATIGDPQVRNWGTIGGSVAHADPASDWPAMLLAVNATIVCRGQSGERQIKARDFFLDTFTTAIEPTEVLTEIRIRRRPKGTGGAYTKLERKVGDFATAGSAVVVGLGAGRTHRDAPGSASRASPRRRSRPRTPRRSSSASSRPRSCSEGPATRPPPRRDPPATSADPSSTSARWPRS